MECSAAHRVAPSVTTGMTALKLIAVNEVSHDEAAALVLTYHYVVHRSDRKTTHHAECQSLSHLVHQFSAPFAFVHSSFVVQFFLPVFALPVYTATCFCFPSKARSQSSSRKAAVRHVFPFIWNVSVLTGWIFVKLCAGGRGKDKVHPRRGHEGPELE